MGVPLDIGNALGEIPIMHAVSSPQIYKMGSQMILRGIPPSTARSRAREGEQWLHVSDRLIFLIFTQNYNLSSSPLPISCVL